ncbi:DNA cytosine methyltransferase [soil metagenome]
MSSGFAARPEFKVVGAVDAEFAKPSSPAGSLQCNRTYSDNIGLEVLGADIGTLAPERLSAHCRIAPGELTVLAACPPCTDFSRAKPVNHLVDTAKNDLVGRVGDFVSYFLPEFVVMENAREMISGRNPHHFRRLRARLEKAGYQVRAEVHLLTRFGLPQIRERALVIASRLGSPPGLEDLWRPFTIDEGAKTVRHAIGHLNRKRLRAGQQAPDDPAHVSPGFSDPIVAERTRAIPKDGGSWRDLARSPATEHLLIPSMARRIAARDFGSHPDVYGRLWWDRPAPTIKRECTHVGNGRYTHPTQDRLLTVREMALIQGFPDTYRFRTKSLASAYRQIGDAVPPLISYQISALVKWMKDGRRPSPDEFVLPGASLKLEDMAPSGIGGALTDSWDSPITAVQARLFA